MRYISFNLNDLISKTCAVFNLKILNNFVKATKKKVKLYLS